MSGSRPRLVYKEPCHKKQVAFAPRKERLVSRAEAVDCCSGAGAGAAAEACARRVCGIIAEFHVPRSLREASVPRDDARRVSAAIHEEAEQFGTVARPLRLGKIGGPLEAAYERP